MNLKIDIPFVDTFLEIPQCAKFLKDILKKAGRWMIYAQLSSLSSVVLQNKLPPNLKDTWIFLFLGQLVLIVLDRLYVIQVPVLI